MGLIFRWRGSFKNTRRLLDIKKKNAQIDAILNKYGMAGVEALSAATPKDTGLTAASWDFRIVHGNNADSIQFFNTNLNKGVNIAIILQYGHGTRNGGYVQGIDYINPVSAEILDAMANEIWTEVMSI